MKPRYRLMKLSDCANGTRFYFYRSKMMLLYTLIAINRKKYEGVYHMGMILILTFGCLEHH